MGAGDIELGGDGFGAAGQDDVSGTPGTPLTFMPLSTAPPDHGSGSPLARWVRLSGGLTSSDGGPYAAECYGASSSALRCVAIRVLGVAFERPAERAVDRAIDTGADGVGKCYEVLDELKF